MAYTKTDENLISQLKNVQQYLEFAHVNVKQMQVCYNTHESFFEMQKF